MHAHTHTCTRHSSCALRLLSLSLDSTLYIPIILQLLPGHQALKLPTLRLMGKYPECTWRGLGGNPSLTCICDTGRHSLRSCRRRLGWRGLRRCSVGTAGSLWRPDSSHRSPRTRSSGWRPRWAAAGQSSPLSAQGSAGPSWLCASGPA